MHGDGRFNIHFLGTVKQLRMDTCKRRVEEIDNKLLVLLSPFAGAIFGCCALSEGFGKGKLSSRKHLRVARYAIRL